MHHVQTSVVGKFRGLVDRLPRWTAYAGLAVIVVVIYLDDVIGSDLRNYLGPCAVARGADDERRSA